MSKSHAIRSGFSAIFRDPLVYVAEVAWRWTYGVASALLIAYGVLLFLNSLPVSDRDAFGLSGIIPGLFVEALANIFRGSGPKMLRIAAMLLAGLGLLWFLAASLGRAATLGSLLNKRPRLQSIFGLHSMRLLVGAAAWIAYFGALAIAFNASRIAGGEEINPSKFYLIFLVLSIVVSTAWSSASWYLSLGPILAARNETSIFDSLYDAAALVRRRGAQFTWVGIVFGVLRTIVWFTAFFFFMTMLSIAMQAPPAVGFAVILLFVAAYSVVSNFLYLARMNSYLRIMDWDEEERLRPPEPMPPPPPSPLLQSPVVPAM
jgi:hypothetical protein